MAQQVRLQRRIHDLRDVRTGIGEGHHAAWVLHHGQHVILIFIGERLTEERVEIRFQADVDHGLGRMHVATRRNVRQQRFVADALHVIEPLPLRRTRFGTDDFWAVIGRGRYLDQLALDGRIAHQGLLLGQRLGANVAPHFPAVEGHARLERQKRRDRTTVGLHEHAPAGFGHLVGELVVGRPHIRCDAQTRHAKGDRAAGLDRELGQTIEIIFYALRATAGRFAGQLENAGTGLAHGVDDRAYFGPVGDTARHRPVVGGLMVVSA